MSDDFDLFQARVEEQLRADVELLIEAAQVKVRAFETVLRARGELDGRKPFAAELLLPAAASLRLPAGAHAAHGADTADVAPVPAAAALGPGPEPAPPTPPVPDFDLYAEVIRALDGLDGTFGRADIARALPFEASRASLYRVLESLQFDRLLIEVEPARGRRAARYRKAAPPTES
ncbi:MAG TPA: hypothetical protein VEG34_10210 [Thermoanaerobaculia bacterium]|nr:hypothetical protein [Thermoanaerobaculia bacterium]